MGVISFASLKGGVGKTSLSVNIAHALANRGCEVLLVDLDPSAHATFFFQDRLADSSQPENTIVRMLLSLGEEAEIQDPGTMLDRLSLADMTLGIEVRERFYLLPGGAELRYFLWGKGALAFKQIFGEVISELASHYDHVIIDTSPDFNVLTRNALAVSDVAVVPVDASAMSIRALEEIVHSAAHMEKPLWAILRTMVNKHASRIQRMSSARLEENLALRRGLLGGGEEELEVDISDPDNFLSLLSKCERSQEFTSSGIGVENSQADQRPIFLLDAIINRTEQQNRLSFLGQTAFDSKSTQSLAKQYAEAAKELEHVIALSEDLAPDTLDGEIMERMIGSSSA